MRPLHVEPVRLFNRWLIAWRWRCRACHQWGAHETQAGAITEGHHHLTVCINYQEQP